MTDIHNIIALGESLQIEFKETFSPKTLAREIVAFANSVGGKILIGVSDEGELKPLELNNKLLSQIQDIARNCEPAIAIELHKHPEHRILEIHVPEGSQKPYQCSDGFYRRIGPNSQKLKSSELIEFITTHYQTSFEEQLEERFNFERDFSKEKYRDFSEAAGIAKQLEPQNTLRNLGVAVDGERGLQFKKIGVLFFAKDVQKFYREAGFTCVRYADTTKTDILNRKDFNGNPIEQIDRATEFVRSSINTRYVISDSPRHRKISDYPLVAIREAITNAVCHRDYNYDLSHCYLHLFSDRLEIENPGGLVQGLMKEDLGKLSVRRNPILADLLFRVGYIEQIGSGFQRIERALQENNNPPYQVSVASFFSITLFPTLAIDSTADLTGRQRRILSLLTERTASKRELAVALDYSEDTILRELRVLLDQNLIKRKGSGRSTRYEIVGGGGS